MANRGRHCGNICKVVMDNDMFERTKLVETSKLLQKFPTRYIGERPKRI